MSQLIRNCLLVVSVFMILFLCASSTLFAESTITCHCFKDRTYNPENRFAADEYILATTFNSLLSKSFDISKQEIVLLKMKDGVSRNDLLIGLKISKSTQESLENLLQLRRQNQTWSHILKNILQKTSSQIDPVLQAIQYGISDKAAGSEVADQIISLFFKKPLPEIKQFRLHGFEEKEISLIFLLAQVSGQPPQDVASMYTDQKKSWSEIAHTYKLEPKATGKIILGEEEKVDIR